MNNLRISTHFLGVTIAAVALAYAIPLQAQSVCDLGAFCDRDNDTYFKDHKRCDICTISEERDCDDSYHSVTNECPTGEPDPSTYGVELTGRVFHFDLSNVEFTTNAKENALFPPPLLALTFSRPPDEEPVAQNRWDAVFNACVNFIGSNPIGDIEPGIIVDKIEIPPGNWVIYKAGGVRLTTTEIPFDVMGNSPPEDGEDAYFSVNVPLIGHEDFDGAPWLPIGTGTSIAYRIFDARITGGTAKGVHPKKGCVSGGVAPTVDFDFGQTRELWITAN